MSEYYVLNSPEIISPVFYHPPEGSLSQGDELAHGHSLPCPFTVTYAEEVSAAWSAVPYLLNVPCIPRIYL